MFNRRCLRISGDWLTIALPQGRLLPESLTLLRNAKIGVPKLVESRQLSFSLPESKVTLLLARPADVAAYVEHGVADLGIVGKDLLAENECQVDELLDLGFGWCRIVLAAPPRVSQGPWDTSRVATKFPRLAATHLAELGWRGQIIKLHGAVELAPIAGMADMVVDITATGQTLAANGLIIVRELMSSTARLITQAAPRGDRMSRLQDLVEAIKCQFGEGDEQQ